MTWPMVGQRLAVYMLVVSALVLHDVTPAICAVALAIVVERPGLDKERP